MDNNAAAKVFGQQLSALRRYRRLTIDELATKTGLSTTAITNLEQGKYLPRVKTLRALDEALGSKVEDFRPLVKAS